MTTGAAPVPALEVRGLVVRFEDPAGGGLREAVSVEALDLAAGEEAAVAGESGSGKTTLLHAVAGILPADAGTVRIAGEAMTGLSEAARDRLRARRVGYVFQTFNLLPTMTALENVALGIAFRPRGKGRPLDLARAALARVGLEGHAQHRPHQLSVGQQQRVAVARALAGRPDLVLADEPTSNLDRATGAACLALLREFARETGAALLVVSHDPAVLGAFARVVTLPSPAPAAAGAGGPR